MNWEVAVVLVAVIALAAETIVTLFPVPKESAPDQDGSPITPADRIVSIDSARRRRHSGASLIVEDGVLETAARAR
jgi:hypothetical protein